MAKFIVGEKVVVRGQAGVVVEVVTHDDHWFKDGCEQIYSVKLDEGVPHMITHRISENGCAIPLDEPVPSPEVHYTTLGGVKESEVSHGVN